MSRYFIFQLTWVSLVMLLIALAFVFRRKSDQIVAQVEPQKLAISYHRPVKIVKLHVMPGQQVRPGDMLVEVERPDLALEQEERETALRNLENELAAEDVNYRSARKRNALDYQAVSHKLELELDQLEYIEEGNQRLLRDFGFNAARTSHDHDSVRNYYHTRIGSLQEQMELEKEMYLSMQRFLDESHREKKQILVNKIEQVRLEVEALVKEKGDLVRLSSIAGTIGAVSVETEEIVPAFQTIMTIYAEHPSVIKAFMNEAVRYPVKVGDRVMVTSTNRRYSIEGQIAEVGSRIVEYPLRLRSRNDIAMWGQELFIRIPEDNIFLNGEKVIVIFD